MAKSFAWFTSLAAVGFSLGVTAVPARAAVVLVGSYSGTECGGKGGFSNCFASQTGTAQGKTDGSSPAIFKYGSDGVTVTSNLFPSIDGSEFNVNYAGATNTLSFSYNPGANDPAIHYFAVKQANGFSLFYDANPITSGSINLTSFFPKTPGYSHITFFDTGSTPSVPEPATWAMMLLGFGGIGFVMRRRRGEKRGLTRVRFAL